MKRKANKYLIVNADDFNLTRGVSKAILYAARLGVVSSTSVFINSNSVHHIAELRKIPSLGVGLHFNITLGRPVSSPSNIRTLITRRGTFKPLSSYRFNNISKNEIFIELEAQIKKFITMFRCLPTHIDTHHHVHFYKNIYTVLSEAALCYKIPIRRRYFKKTTFGNKGIITTDYIFGRFNPGRHWRKRSLIQTVKRLKKGVTELIVHPGFSDAQLKRKSSFNIDREYELKGLSGKEFKETIEEKRVALINFNDLKYLKMNVK